MNISLEDAYQASELVCCDIQQQLDNLNDRDQRHNLENSLNNAEIARDYLLHTRDLIREMDL